MSVRSKIFLVGKKIPTFFLNYVIFFFHHNFSHPYSVSMSTNECARSDWSIFLIFLFLILLVPLLYRFKSSFNAILPSSHTTGVLAIFFANFKILLPKPRPCPCWTAVCR